MKCSSPFKKETEHQAQENTSDDNYDLHHHFLLNHPGSEPKLRDNFFESSASSNVP